MAPTGWKNALYGFGVLAGLLALILVPALVSAALPREGPPLTGSVEIGYGARLVVPSGARLDLVDSRPGDGEIVLLVGEDGLRLRITAQVFRGDPDPFVAHARHKLSRDESFRPAGPPEPLTTATGLRGEMGSLAGAEPGDESGCYSVVTGDHVGVTTLVTPVRDCAALPAPVAGALRSVQVRG